MNGGSGGAKPNANMSAPHLTLPDAKPAEPQSFVVQMKPPGGHKSVHPHRIEINQRDISQLFNSMDPSPFHEKDLDHDAEEFILSWAQEYHRHEPVSLVIHLKDFPKDADPKPLVEQAVHNYFAHRARLNQLEFKRLMKQGRLSLVIGLLFLASCLLASELLIHQKAGSGWNVLREGLTIAGWVAMWRPMQIYLYDWWPLRRRGQIFEKLSRMHIEVRKQD
jgi:hypothetical protein